MQDSSRFNILKSNIYIYSPVKFRRTFLFFPKACDNSR